ncbi:VPGUxxT family thioredoxin-like (seleno)protein, type 2 [Candidatus Uabimicrobium sp. HlEnr_7]|uniref:VPGUxxT family thioredoxin-like (seleno)protein, type 2 n=1 Tax=Candidatus Uabimicrobium helgolandensis TaxID=3095367 RepID=UPI003556FF0A
MRKYTIIIAIITTYVLFSNTTADTPRELGQIKWQRNFSKALQQAKKEKKPLMVLFDEVPGCSTCVNFGQGPLQNPMIVAAAESEFVPVVVYNNHSGKDAQILRRFGEPSWNNPVIRFFDHNQKDLIPRQQGYSNKFLLVQMVKALKATNKNVPLYLQLALSEYDKNKLQKATFAMYCYWSGESKLAGVKGVKYTMAGHLNGYEVVDVYFDPQTIDYEQLVIKANNLKCNSRIFARTKQQLKTAKKIVHNKAVYSKQKTAAASPKDQKYQLRRFPQYYYLPLTFRQATLLNNALVSGKRDYHKYLSPLQIKLSNQIKRSWPNRKVSSLVPQRSMKNLSRYYVKLKGALDPQN